MPVKRHVVAVGALASLVVAIASGACGQSNKDSSFQTTGPAGNSSASGSGSGGSGDDGSMYIPGGSSGILTFDGSNTTPACEGGTGWQCKVDKTCSTPTTLSGKVFDPAGKNPLYNVVVFIPNDVSTLPRITQGTRSCNTCDVSIGGYVAATTTDYTGAFTLTGVPHAKGVPVTVQTGKWRRTISVDINNDCGTNTVSTAPGSNPLLRLPGKKGDGDMPEIALLTGGCDDMACFLMNIGIDQSEFTGPHAGGRVDVYQGNSAPLGVLTLPGPTLTPANGTAGNCTNTSCPLWASKAGFEPYDLVMLSCECGEGTASQTAAAHTNLRDWLDEGGKVFASHYHYTWFENNPSADFKAVANWGNTGNNDVASTQGQTYDIDTSFPKAITFGKWLGVVGALNSAGAGPPSYSPPPDIKLGFVADSVRTVNGATNRWIYDPAVGAGEGGTANDVKYLSFGTPIGGAPPPDGSPETKQYCGKAVYTDLHTGGSLTASASDVPGKCTAGDLSAQQKALEFLFFDLAACVTDDKKEPPLPPPPPM
jgi:hypothetical protein